MPTTQKKINWTEQQSRAISEHGRNVLVSASAGTGKTAVLSGSCVDAVTKQTCPDVWSILVVTFTDMAAEQMRSRIAEQLNSAIAAAANDELRRHLRRQLVLLGAADVSTIHSFCKRLITEHFYCLDLDPTFGVIDADEAKLLKAEALEKTIDWGWRQENLAAALRQLLARRDLRLTEGFPSRIIEISDFLDGVVSRDDWLRRAQVLAETADPLTTDLADAQKQIISSQLQDSLSRLDCAVKIYQANNPAGQWAAKCRKDYIGAVQQCFDSFKAGRWEFKRPRVSKPTDVPQPDLIAEMVGEVLDAVKELKELAILNPDYLVKFAGAVGLQTMVLIELVKRFDNLYRQAKNAINCLDFADLEHYALRLLTTEQLSGEKLEPSATALALREKYKYIFVDEYQDINGVQQAILDMLSHPGRVFAVGDPKQSIYQWRGANPDIFINNLKRASAKPAGDLGLRVDLNVNFRSVKPILDFVNAVFSRIMTGSFTNIDYDEPAHLRPALPAAPTAQTSSAVELHVLNEHQPGDESSQLFNNRQLQAAMIANRIKQLVGVETNRPELLITDKKTGGLKPVEYSDIVILMRSLAGKNDFLEVLRLSGIPVSCEATAGYFEATEITDMLCLLKVLDNPRRDIEFAAVMRSPVFNFTDTELATIRLTRDVARASSPCKHGQDGRATRYSFYDCVLKCSQSKDDPDLAGKVNNALDVLDGWRTIARRGRLAEVIWHIYRQTGLLSFVYALPDGLARKANLLKLHDRAIQFESFAGNTGVPSLARFIEFIEKLLAAGQDWAPAEPESAAGNAVRVLSVHKSKGLEFPVVFLADLNSPFNKKADARDCLLDEQLTLGLQVIDPETGARLDSLGHQVIEEHNRRKSLAEEMRILYVAMTRAMNRLILVGCKDKKSCPRIITSASFFGNQAIPHWHLASCQSHLDWILSALSGQTRLHRTFETTLLQQADNNDLFSIRFYDQQELARLSSAIQNSKLKTHHSKLKTHTGKQVLASIKSALDWRYPFGDAPRLPAKRSVTQWTHRNDEFARLDYSRSLDRKPKTILDAEQIDSLNIGSAIHLVLSQLDLNKPIKTEAITQLINKLIADGSITPSVAAQINIESIVEFFETDLGQMMLDKNNVVWREWPFTTAIPASQWSESETLNTIRNPQSAIRDTIIVQGIIDLLIKTPKGLVIVDYKTDNVSANEAPPRAELYRRQLDLYAQAAEAIIGIKVHSKWLYFLTPGCKIEV